MIRDILKDFPDLVTCFQRLPPRKQKIILKQYRTIPGVESRRQIFLQVKQKCWRILCVFASIFVTVAGKSASEAALKASAVNCAVLP